MVNVEDGATILLYHGVSDSPSFRIENCSGKHIPAKAFERQMAQLQQNSHIMTLREMAGKLVASIDLPPRSVAVTFDDTFKNNRSVALPILKRYGVPATFFVTTGFADNHRRFWVDQVEHCINLATTSEISNPIAEEDERCFSLRTHANRIHALVEIKKAMKLMGPQERDETLTKLKQLTAVDDSGQEVANYQNMDWDDILTLDDPPFYEVGGHTVNHEIMAYLQPEQLHYEVEECLQELESHLEHKVDLFAYPEGQAHHYNEQVISVLKENGVTICPSAIDGINKSGIDPFHLRRTTVGFMGVGFPFDAV